ncbi:hypothetical protein BDZ97DRAFT_1759822 [Flammula alnicola]|nr:hypothetical protein BDZ97DRAFT_1759822 [Flammula alnicola]
MNASPAPLPTFPFLLVLLNVLVPAGIHISATAPTPKTPKERQLSGDLPGIASVLVVILKYACWTHAAVELIVTGTIIILSVSTPTQSAHWQGRVASFLLPAASNTPSQPPIHLLNPLRVLAALSILTGSLIRYLCYRSLGPHFTFHITLLPSHKLITTGPYAIVRHPAYAGGVLMHLGLVLWHIAPGAWLRESGVCWRVDFIMVWAVLVPGCHCVAESCGVCEETEGGG